MCFVDSGLHWRRNFVELNDDVHRTLTLVDITNPARTNIVKQLSLPVGLVSPGVEAIVGNVALLPGGLICLTDASGLWILKQEAAPDVQLDAAYGNYIFYGLH